MGPDISIPMVDWLLNGEVVTMAFTFAVKNRSMEGKKSCWKASEKGSQTSIDKFDNTFISSFLNKGRTVTSTELDAIIARTAPTEDSK